MTTNEQHIDKMVEDTIQSLDGANRAQPKPFLISRVMASVSQRSNAENIWTQIGAFISRPSIAFTGLALLILMNAAIFFIRSNNAYKPNVVQSNASLTDEFAINANNIYDFENIDQ